MEPRIGEVSHLLPRLRIVATVDGSIDFFQEGCGIFIFAEQPSLKQLGCIVLGHKPHNSFLKALRIPKRKATFAATRFLILWNVLTKAIAVFHPPFPAIQLAAVAVLSEMRCHR